MRAVGRYIVIQPITEEVESAGLIMAGKDKDEMRYRRATVVSPGTEVSSVKQGETIHYDTRNAFSLALDGEPYTVITERDVVLID